MSTIFKKIISGELPSFKVAENAEYLAFLDINPLKEGHTLVIPKQEVDYIFDMADSHIADLIIFSKKVAVGIKKVIPCAKIGVSVVGLEVAHAHIHLIPINSVSEMNFAAQKLSVAAERMKELSELIAEAIN